MKRKKREKKGRRDKRKIKKNERKTKEKERKKKKDEKPPFILSSPSSPLDLIKDGCVDWIMAERRILTSLRHAPFVVSLHMSFQVPLFSLFPISPFSLSFFPLLSFPAFLFPDFLFPLCLPSFFSFFFFFFFRLTLSCV